jgi:hypothetical protein
MARSVDPMPERANAGLARRSDLASIAPAASGVSWSRTVFAVQGALMLTRSGALLSAANELGR